MEPNSPLKTQRPSTTFDNSSKQFSKWLKLLELVEALIERRLGASIAGAQTGRCTNAFKVSPECWDTLERLQKYERGFQRNITWRLKLLGDPSATRE